MAGTVRQPIHVAYNDGTLLQNELDRRFPGEARTIKMQGGQYMVYGPRLLTQDELTSIETAIRVHYNERSQGRSR
ncbi:hypothetical protein DL546_007438 [Coniochaeta pulveracea]|uniref:Uncharacterized protein n=1 Tax=Coniochaeta pulveracea TaxID=177199 RepID=A0A420YLT5_9PEZI|nr:hypothetical protein DL546_007438 [Coniochaeta pulveracea]